MLVAVPTLQRSCRWSQSSAQGPRSGCPSLRWAGASVPGKVSASGLRPASVPRPEHHPRPQPGRRTWGSPAQLHVRVTFQLLHQLFLCWLLQDVPAKWGEGAQGCLEKDPRPLQKSERAEHVGPSCTSSPWGKPSDRHRECGRTGDAGLRSIFRVFTWRSQKPGGRPSRLTAGAGWVSPARAQPTPGGRSGRPELGCPWDDQNRSVPERKFPHHQWGRPETKGT